MAELELSVLEPPYVEAFPPTECRPALGAVAIGRIYSPRGFTPGLAPLLEQSPWVIPFVVVAPACLSPEVLQAMWGLPTQPAFLVTPRPTERTSSATVLEAIAARPVPPTSLIIAYVVRRTGSVVLGETLDQVWSGRRGGANADRTVRYRFRKHGDYGRHDWNRVRRLVAAKAEGSDLSVEQVARLLNTEARTVRGWVRRYVGTSMRAFLATAGDPLGRSGSWLSGVDFTYSTTSFLGNKNFSINAWAVATGRDGLHGDTMAQAFKIDYPNDKWDMRLWYRRIGADFDPSLGFVPRRAMQRWNPAISNRTRFARGLIQDVSHGVNPYITLDLEGQWESLDSPIQSVWRFRSGDRVQAVVTLGGDRPTQPFQISPGVVVPPGSYTWVRRNVGFTTAQKRRLYTSLGWTTGSFYDGDLTQWDWTVVWNPTALYTVELTAERNEGDLPAGRFTQNVLGTRLRVNVSPDLSVATYAQYDTESKSVGINSRLRWTFLPVADLFVVYNHNVRSLVDRWELESNQLLIKLQYAWRM